MLVGTCHCGAVEVSYEGVPERLVSCNCSICRRLRPLWAHGPKSKLGVKAAPDTTKAYIWGDKSLAFYSCVTCGVTTHWVGIDPENSQNMAVNFALMPPAKIRDFQSDNSMVPIAGLLLTSYMAL